MALTARGRVGQYGQMEDPRQIVPYSPLIALSLTNSRGTPTPLRQDFRLYA